MSKLTDVTGHVLVPAVDKEHDCNGCAFSDAARCPQMEDRSDLPPKDAIERDCDRGLNDQRIWIPDTEEGRGAYIARKLTS